MDRVRSMLELLLAQDTGRTVDQVRADTERDVVLTARAAVDYGLVDRVLDHRQLAPWAAH